VRGKRLSKTIQIIRWEKQVQGAGFRVQGAMFTGSAPGPACTASRGNAMPLGACSGYEVQGSWFRVLGLGCGIRGVASPGYGWRGGFWVLGSCGG
jgi:hypothetical protein